MRCLSCGRCSNDFAPLLPRHRDRAGRAVRRARARGGGPGRAPAGAAQPPRQRGQVRAAAAAHPGRPGSDGGPTPASWSRTKAGQSPKESASGCSSASTGWNREKSGRWCRGPASASSSGARSSSSPAATDSCSVETGARGGARFVIELPALGRGPGAAGSWRRRAHDPVLLIEGQRRPRLRTAPTIWRSRGTR